MREGSCVGVRGGGGHFFIVPIYNMEVALRREPRIDVCTYLSAFVVAEVFCMLKGYLLTTVSSECCGRTLRHE